MDALIDYWSNADPLVQGLLALTVGLPVVLLLAALFMVAVGLMLGAIGARRRVADEDPLPLR